MDVVVDVVDVVVVGFAVVFDFARDCFDVCDLAEERFFLVLGLSGVDVTATRLNHRFA